MDQQQPRLFGMPQQGGVPDEGGVTYTQIDQPSQTQTITTGVTHPALQAQQQDPTDNLADFEDYWGFSQEHTFIMPDGRQTITFKTLTEGDIGQMSKMLKRDVIVEKRTGDARFRMDQNEERRALIATAVTGWTLVRRNNAGQFTPVPFSKGTPGSNLDQWIDRANPAIVADLETAIRKANPALIQNTADTIEAIDKEMAELAERRAELVARERGEGSSATR
jgi:hypothetical protein